MKITSEGRARAHLYSTDTGGNPVLPNPDDPPPAPDTVDVALDSDAFVPIATASSPGFVQFKNAQFSTSGTRAVTLDADPTPGNILVMYYSSRSGAGSSEVLGPTDWTAHADSPVYGGTLIGGAPACPTFGWWHVVQTGDGAYVDVRAVGDGGNPANITLLEVAGVDTLIDSPSANQVTSNNPKLTGVVGSNDAIFLVGADVQQDGGLAYTPDSGTTEIYDDSIGGDTWPEQWIGYRIESTPGSYDVGATGLFSLPWGALGFVFDSGGGGVFQQVAPLTVDGDDATFNESDLEEIVRLDIGAAQRLTSAHLLVGYDSSGSRTVHLWAGNESDLSDAVEVTSETFSATGGGTGDEVVFTIADTTSYRYWEFRGPVEHTKTYTVEMFAFQQSFDLSGYQLLSQKDQPNGYAGLTADGQVPDDEIADGGASDGDVPISNGDGTRTWGPMAGGGGTPSDTVSDETTFDLTPDAGAATEYSRGDHTHGSPPTPTGGVTEITDLPTAETDTSLVLAPDGVGGVEWRAESGGGGGMLAPVVVQAKGSVSANTQNPAVTFANAPGTDHVIVVGVNLVGRGVSSISCTNVTFTLLASFTSGGGSHYEIWIGKPTASTAPGSTVTVNTPSSNFASVEIMEIVATVTPTVGATYAAAIDFGNGGGQMGPLAVTAGRLVVFFGGHDNTTGPILMYPFMPAYVHAQRGSGTGCALGVGYASVGSAGALFDALTDSGGSLMAEVT